MITLLIALAAAVEPAPGSPHPPLDAPVAAAPFGKDKPVKPEGTIGKPPPSLAVAEDASAEKPDSGSRKPAPWSHHV